MPDKMMHRNNVVADKMAQRNNVHVVSTTRFANGLTVDDQKSTDTASYHNHMLKHWETENEKWREYCTGCRKAGIHAKLAKVNYSFSLTRVTGYAIGLRMSQRKQTSGSKNLPWFSISFKEPEPADPEYENLSIREKFARHIENKKQSGSTDLLQVVLMRGLMVFQAPTQIFVFTYYVVPYIFQDYDPWVNYYMKVLCWFVLLNGLANWFCVILYSPAYKRSKDNPFLQITNHNGAIPERFEARCEQAASNQNELNGHCIYDMTSKEGLPWNFCDKCKLYVPPRAHHCNFCKHCILKRDHHCFMVGNCIGFKNQRYFIVLAFYAMITGIVGGYFNYKYIQGVIWPALNSWTDVVFPITIWKTIFGNVKGIQCLIIVHQYLEFLFGVVGFVYFSSQMTITANGKTLFEVAKNVPIVNRNSVNRNMKSVFGDFWVLNFLFPMTVIFRQRDDGIHWDGIKIDHNANKQWKDDGEIL